jgi:hypothetical protein
MTGLVVRTGKQLPLAHTTLPVKQGHGPQWIECDDRCLDTQILPQDIKNVEF